MGENGRQESTCPGMRLTSGRVNQDMLLVALWEELECSQYADIMKLLARWHRQCCPVSVHQISAKTLMVPRLLSAWGWHFWFWVKQLSKPDRLLLDRVYGRCFQRLFVQSRQKVRFVIWLMLMIFSFASGLSYYYLSSSASSDTDLDEEVCH